MTDLPTVLEESRRLGFLGPGPVEPHIEHAAAFADVVDSTPARALDLGAGGGLPGLVLATRHGHTSWTFVDSQQRRTTFLQWAVEHLGIADRVEIVTERAETVGRQPRHRGRYDLVTARSFGPPAVTAECAAPLLDVGGHLVVSEPPDALEDRWLAEGLARLGLGPAEHRRIDRPTRPVHLVRIARLADVPDRFPRRVGIPTKRPLF